jgi:hypothetical protein
MSLSASRRQYIGVTVSGARIVYGNYFPKSDDNIDWRKYPILICDGGRSYFGVVFDPLKNKILNISFNGP